MEVVFITFVKPITFLSTPFTGFLTGFTTIQVNFGVKGYVLKTILCDILFQKLSSFCWCFLIIHYHNLRSCYKGETNCHEKTNCRYHSFRRPGISWEFLGILVNSWDLVRTLGNSWDLVGSRGNLGNSWELGRILDE